ncbi:unnamed protein product [Mytilus coruscus]|uniref:Uncharacterized protein n=1 Tax=Mytilus coruscus TaxID=42192 RepID=A0A6J8CD76_MYTCO|nr:unnamed protein product [Mytilus coruscus]
MEDDVSQVKERMNNILSILKLPEFQSGETDPDSDLINEILKTPQEQIISYQSTSPASSSRQSTPRASSSRQTSPNKPPTPPYQPSMLRLQYGLDSYHLTRGSADRAASGEIVHSGQWVKSLKGDEDTWIGSFREKEKGESSKPRKRINKQDPNAYFEYVSAQKRGKNSCPNFLEVPIFRNFQKSELT